MERALYGPHGFYRTRGGPAAHFRTSVHASPLFATAIVRLLREIDDALGHPGEIALVDVGAGRGELLESVRTQLADERDSSDPLTSEPLTADALTSELLASNRPSGDPFASNPSAGEPLTGNLPASHLPTDHPFASGPPVSNPPTDDPHAGEPLASDPPASEPRARDPLVRDSLADRLRLIAVELANRPDNLITEIEWRNELPEAGTVTGLLVANEWLDNVPCDVVQATHGSWHSVEVAADGTERLGAAPSREQQAWLSTWWPTDGPSDPAGPPQRAEVGSTRDAAWQKAVAALAHGVAIAIDYAHTRTSRPHFGTITGYAQGRQTVPVPDGSCDITAHVALDACAAATRAEWTVQSDQRTVFHSLGITGARPALSLASSDPRGYLRALAQASAAAELTDADGLGGFGWLVQGISVPMPPSLAQITRRQSTGHA